MRILLLFTAILTFSVMGLAQSEGGTRNDCLTGGNGNVRQFAELLFQAFKMAGGRAFPGGRSVTSCGVVNNPQVYYMGTTGGGVWKTENAGWTWINVSDGFFRTGSVGAVAVAESDPNVVYVGMGEHAPRGVMSSYGDGVYKSTGMRVRPGKRWGLN